MNDLWVHQYQSLTLGNKFLHFFVPSFWSKLLRSTAIETWNQKESIEKRSGKDALKLVFKRLARTKKESYSLTLNDADGGCKSAHWIRISLLFLHLSLIERGHPFFRHRILAKKVCSQKLWAGEKITQFVRSFTKKNQEVLIKI